ncbi:sulfite exporter TauE/SafE family protein [Aurantimonas sp. E1-2-R+4]|uniref:sulfite exporter TauE/SafE family protein n=1 Tax=Aurantimonas sp. E1-2-R+4 TaxID=3113714 RepID=UPI002F91F63D
MITDPIFYLAAIPAVLLIGLSKGGFGGSISLVGVPLMAMIISPVAAAGILLPIMVVMDAISLYAWRGRFDRTLLLSMLPAAIGGVGLGYLTAAFVSADGVRLLLGLLALWFAADWFFRSRHRSESKESRPLRANVWGAISGFSSFVSHAGGPPYQIYVLPLRLSPQIYAGTSAVFFAGVNAVKLLPYSLLGQFSTGNLMTSAVLLPLAPVATLIGVWLVRKVDPAAFYIFTYALLVPVGLKLVFDGAAAMLP